MSLLGFQDSFFIEALVGLLCALLGVVIAILVAEIICFGVMMTWTWHDSRPTSEQHHGHSGLLQ